jgi:hypothetical protein
MESGVRRQERVCHSERSEESRNEQELRSIYSMAGVSPVS